MPILTLLVVLVVAALVVGLLLYLVSVLPLDPAIKGFIRTAVIVVCVIVLIVWLLGLVGVVSVPLRV